MALQGRRPKSRDRLLWSWIHRILTITDPRNIVFLTNTSDSNGRVSQQIQADGSVWQLADELNGGNVSSVTVTDPRGNARRYRLDSHGNTLSRTDGQTTAFEDAEGSPLLLATTDPLGRRAGPPATCDDCSVCGTRGDSKSLLSVAGTEHWS
jgi:YD repeat-containing protein